MTASERRWAKAKMYPSTLELKTVCQSPECIQYLDLEVGHDRAGFYTSLYDKRDALREKAHLVRCDAMATAAVDTD